MVKDDDLTKEYLKGVQNKVFEKFNEIFQMINDIDDVQENWKDA